MHVFDPFLAFPDFVTTFIFPLAADSAMAGCPTEFCSLPQADATYVAHDVSRGKAGLREASPFRDGMHVTHTYQQPRSLHLQHQGTPQAHSAGIQAAPMGIHGWRMPEHWAGIHRHRRHGRPCPCSGRHSRNHEPFRRGAEDQSQFVTIRGCGIGHGIRLASRLWRIQREHFADGGYDGVYPQPGATSSETDICRGVG